MAKKVNTGSMILSMIPVYRQMMSTTIHTAVHLPEMFGFMPGMRQGQILLPSKGGMGRRFITARIALMKKMLVQINSINQ